MIQELENVNQKWVHSKMKETGTKLKRLSLDIGISYSDMFNIIDRDRFTPLFKAVFYYYFLVKQQTRQ